MIKLATECRECLHRNVCRNKDNPKRVMEKLIGSEYEKGHDWDHMTEVMHVNVTFSCPDYESIYKDKEPWHQPGR